METERKELVGYFQADVKHDVVMLLARAAVPDGTALFVEPIDAACPEKHPEFHHVMLAQPYLADQAIDVTAVARELETALKLKDRKARLVMP